MSNEENPKNITPPLGHLDRASEVLMSEWAFNVDPTAWAVDPENEVCPLPIEESDEYFEKMDFMDLHTLQPGDLVRLIGRGGADYTFF